MTEQYNYIGALTISDADINAATEPMLAVLPIVLL